MMAITGGDDFVSRAAGEWRNSSERVIAIIIRSLNNILFCNESCYPMKNTLQ
jgi:hypothetical protein